MGLDDTRSKVWAVFSVHTRERVTDIIRLHSIIIYIIISYIFIALSIYECKPVQSVLQQNCAKKGWYIFFLEGEIIAIFKTSTKKQLIHAVQNGEI